MSILKTSVGSEIPIRQRRETNGTLASLSAEVVLDLSGDQNATVTLVCNSFVGTIDFFGASDSTGTSYYPIACFPSALGSVGGTATNSPGQPQLTDVIAAGSTIRTYNIPVGQIKRLRVRVAAFTSGSAICNIITDVNPSINTAIIGTPNTLISSSTAAVGVGLTSTLPAVPGLRHVIDFIRVTRSATIVLTASATPVVITTTNIPGALALTLGQDAAAIGVDRELVLDFGSTGMACSLPNTATTIVCPIYAGVIWRTNVSYRLSA